MELTRTLPTLIQLNEMHSAAKVTLIQFRCLCTSDLSWHYSLYKASTLADLIDTGESLINIEGQDALTEEELEEFKGYCAQLREEIALQESQ